MNSTKERPVNPWPFIILFFVISVAAIISGLWFYKNQKKELLQSATKELSTIADLKARQIVLWRGERLSDGYYLSRSNLLNRQLSDYLCAGGNRENRLGLQHELKILTEAYEYKDVLVVDENLNVRLFYPDADTLIGDYLKSRLPELLSKGEVVLTDIHQTGKVSYVHLDLVVPIINSELGTRKPSGLMILRIDPETTLYPLLRSWPVTSNSSESLIIRPEGDQIVYLNELRHLSNTGALMRRPLSEVDLAASMAVNGIKESVNAVDYRGVPVIAAMKKVPDSPWYLVAKVDREEAFAGINRQMGNILIIEILFLMAAGSILGIILRNQRLKFYREKYESEVRHRALVRHFDYILKFANDIILLTDSDYNIVEANDKALETYQFSREEFIGMNISKLRTGLSAVKFIDDIKIINETGELTFEALHKKKDGSVFPVEFSARLVDIEGVKYYQSIGRDITERKKVEEALRSSEQRFRKVFEDSPFGMVLTTKDLSIIEVNSAFARMLDYSESEFTGLTFKNFTHPDNISDDEVSLLKLVAQEIPIYRTEKRYIRKDGSVIWASTTVNIIRNELSEVQFFLAMVEDITARKKTESELIAAKEKAEESDKLKTAFLHNVSHEIRTPMNAILGFSALLAEPDITEAENKQFTGIIQHSGNQLLSIINDIVDLAGIESGQVRINTGFINLNSTLRQLSEQFSYREKPKKIALSLKTPLPQKEAEILTDRTKLVQILSNLINNAFKFTKKGKIEFGYELRTGFIEFFVKDTGIGIPQEHLSRIFDRFYQVDSAASRQYSGTGLGLSICKAYVELLGGKIWVESIPGKGSAFYFTHPYRRKTD